MASIQKRVSRDGKVSYRAQVRVDDWASALANLDLMREVCEAEARGAFGDDDLRRFVDWNQRRNEELTARLEGESDNQAELAPEDDALLLRAWQLRVGKWARFCCLHVILG